MMTSLRCWLPFALAQAVAALGQAGELPPLPSAVAHQGGASPAPANSIASIERSIGDTVERVEVDVRLGRDGRNLPIGEAEPDQQPIPTLEEALATAKGRIKLHLACSQIDPARLASAVIQAGMEREVVISAPLDAIRTLRSAPGGDRLDLMLRWRPADGLDAAGESKPSAVEIEASDATPALCDTLHGRGLKVQARTLGADDAPEVWDRMAGAGVDRILTDHAEEILARAILRRLGNAARVKIAHHRGASRYAPENTLPAYEKSIRLGADFVEFDIRTTRDGVPFLLHDGRLDRTTDARGPIRDRDAAEVARLDAGAWFGRSFVGTPVPTLDGFLKAIGGRVELYVDAKEITPEALVAALRARGLIDRSVVYQSADYLARLRSIEPALRRMPPLSDPAQVARLADRVAPYAFDARWSSLSKPLIDECHARGIKVFSDALGLNESVDRYRQAIRDGIDLIQTDHPVRVLRALDAATPPGQDGSTANLRRSVTSGGSSSVPGKETRP